MEGVMVANMSDGRALMIAWNLASSVTPWSVHAASAWANHECTLCVNGGVNGILFVTVGVDAVDGDDMVRGVLVFCVCVGSIVLMSVCESRERMCNTKTAILMTGFSKA